MADDTGWLKLWRVIRDTKRYNWGRFDQTHAWIDLLLMADFKTGKINISQRSLAKNWKWGIARVNEFFKRLKTDRQIDYAAKGNFTKITILNWQKYQNEAYICHKSGISKAEHKAEHPENISGENRNTNRNTDLPSTEQNKPEHEPEHYRNTQDEKPEHKAETIEEVLQEDVKKLRSTTTNKNAVLIEKIVFRINELSGYHNKPDTRKTVSLINALVKAGHTEEDFLAVVENQWKVWNEPRSKDIMLIHFVPETLFRESNFNKYLAVAKRQQPKKPGDMTREELEKYYGYKKEDDDGRKYV